MDPVVRIVEAVTARFQDELSAQLRTMTVAHERALADTRAKAEVEAEEKWSALLTSARTETQALVESAVSAARAEFEEEKRRSGTQGRAVLRSLRALDDTSSLSATLDVVLGAAAECAQNARLYLLEGTGVREWQGSGAASTPDDAPNDIVTEAERTRTPVRRERTVAVPLMVHERTVAVLWAADARSPDDVWMTDAELVGRIGGSRLTYLTAMRVLQARQWLSLE